MSIEAIKQYLGHLDDCYISQGKCDCGYDEALEELAAHDREVASKALRDATEIVKLYCTETGLQKLRARADAILKGE